MSKGTSMIPPPSPSIAPRIPDPKAINIAIKTKDGMSILSKSVILLNESYGIIVYLSVIKLVFLLSVEI